MSVDISKAKTLANWFKKGKVVLWHNLEIGGSHPSQVFTFDSDNRPNWRYGNPKELGIDAASTIEVHWSRRVKEGWRHRTECKYCHGLGIRTLAEMRKYGHSSLDGITTRDERLTYDGNVSPEYFVCRPCNGKGYDLKYVSLRAVCDPWGRIESERVKEKMDRIKLDTAVSWDLDVDNLIWEVGYFHTRRVAEFELWEEVIVGTIADLL